MSGTIPFYIPIINITINKNEEYIGTKYPELISYEETDQENDIITKYPFEFDIPVCTFKTIWSALGLELDNDFVEEDEVFLTGSIDANDLLDALDKIIPELCYKDGREPVMCTCCGQLVYEEVIDKEYLDEIVNKLYEIARAAVSRGEEVIWN